MQGVGIYDGDVLIVDRHETARNGDVIVANFNGLFVVGQNRSKARQNSFKMHKIDLKRDEKW